MRNYIRKLISRFKNQVEKERIQLIQQKCKHEHWNCDTQIRTIEFDTLIPKGNEILE